MTHRVTFHPLARTDLFDLYAYIEKRSGPARAGGYLERIEALCRSLSDFPDRGVDRSDLGPAVRSISLERRVLVAYRTFADRVEVLRVLYAGRDFTTDDLPHGT